jgi:sporulation protein YlmC with PRC-barrel domain
MHMYSGDGERVGDVEAIEVDATSRRIARIAVRKGFLFGAETSIPASLITSVGDSIRLRATADAAKRLETA